MPEFTNPYIVELSVLRGSAGCLWFNVIKAGHKPIDFFTFLKVTYISASADKDTTLGIVFHSVWIGQFLLGLCFIGFGDGQSLRYKYPV